MTRMTAWPVTEWTLDQLAERVGAALSVDYDGQASGRVREVPDQRAIRYYTTIGLVDRPAAMRGRTALYVRRHLLQLVAIKRLQADGLSLARIQRELAGATNAQLERVARIPPAEDPATASVAPAAGVEAPVSALEAEAAGEVVAMQGVRLGDGVMLLVEGARRLGDGEVAAIWEAARPLLDLVR